MIEFLIDYSLWALAALLILIPTACVLLELTLKACERDDRRRWKP